MGLAAAAGSAGVKPGGDGYVRDGAARVEREAAIKAEADKLSRAKLQAAHVAAAAKPKGFLAKAASGTSAAAAAAAALAGSSGSSQVASAAS